MLLNYKYEIFPTSEQEEILTHWISLCRQTYNSALLDKQRVYKQQKKNYTRSMMQTQQTADKKQHAFLKEVPSQPLQEVFFRLEKAFQKFFKREAKYPKLKKHKDYRSLTFTQFGIGTQFSTCKKTGTKKRQVVRRACSLSRGGKLQIAKLGLIDIAWHRKLDGRVKQVIIKHQGTRWYAIFSVERRANQAVLSYKHSTSTIGVDVGIRTFATLSNGEEIKNPSFLRKEEKKLKRAQRALSGKKKGSCNWYKQLQKVQALHTKVANQRKDFLHKISFRLSQAYGIICVEDLRIRNMVRNRKLAKSIQDAGWGMFRSFLTYKCHREGGLLVKVKPHYTSQECSICGTMVHKSLSVRTHVCPSCSIILDRDHNAARNIEKAGLIQLGHIAAN